MFGKLMSISDDLMWRYFELLSFEPQSVIDGYRRDIDGGANPRDVKFKLAGEIVARFHDEAAARKALDNFVARFRKNEVPDDMPEVALKCPDGALGIGYVLRDSGLTSSTGEAFRMMKQGAVRVDGERVEDRAHKLDAGASYVVQVGKRKFARITLSG